MTETIEAEVVEEHGQEVTLATIQVTPAEAKQQNEQINAVIREVLVEGKDGDYWKIPGTGTPTLLQPGAETLQRFFGLGRKLADPVLGMVDVEGGSYFSAMVKCSVTNPSDRVISEAFGYCDDTEKKRGGGPGSKWLGNRHTIIQMATKRAYVTAIKNATGTSNHFTADMEDSQERPSAPVVEDALPSDADKLALATLYARKKPATVEEGAAWVASYPDKSQSRAWVARQCLNLLTRPDPLPPGTIHTGTPEELARLGPEPEIPVEIPGQTTIDDDPTEIIEDNLTDPPF